MSNEKPQFSKEVRIIPGWAIGLAFVLFIGVQVLMHLYGFRHGPPPPPFPVPLLVTVFLGLLGAFLVLMVGYVNRDAKRRNMNSTLGLPWYIVSPLWG